MYRKISVLELVYDDVRRLDLRTLVLSPSLRICLSPVDYGATHTVHSNSFCSNTGSLLKPLAVLLYLESVECALHIFSYNCSPETTLCLLHVDDSEGSLCSSRVIKPYLGSLSIRSPHSKLSLISVVHTLFECRFRHGMAFHRCT